MVDEIVFWLICAIAAARGYGGRFLGKAPASAEARASRVPWAGGDKTPSAGRTLTSPTSALRSSFKGA